jgi:integrase
MNRRAKGEGSIYFEEDRSRWVGVLGVGVDPVSGRRRRRKVTGPTRKAVAAKLDEIRSQARDGLRVDASPTVGDLYGPWIDRKAERVTAKTVKMYRDLWASHVGPIFQDRQVEAITVADVERFLAARNHLRAGSLRKIRGLLAQLIDEAVRHRVVSFNAARLAVLPVGSPPPRKSRSLTFEETAALLAAADGERLEAWLVTALHTGARPGELAALTWDDVDLDQATMRVAASKTDTHRTIRLARHVIDVLRAHRKRLAEERLLMADRWPRSDLVFVSEAGTALDARNLRRSLTRIAQTAGLRWTPTPYTMRHSHASLLSDSGVQAEHLAQRLGHADSRTTSAYYIHPVTPIVEAGAELDLRAGNAS